MPHVWMGRVSFHSNSWIHVLQRAARMALSVSQVYTPTLH